MPFDQPFICGPNTILPSHRPRPSGAEALARVHLAIHGLTWVPRLGRNAANIKDVLLWNLVDSGARKFEDVANELKALVAGSI